MIRVDRNAVPMPKLLERGRSGPADREFERALAHYRDYERNRQRGGFAFTLYRHRSVRAALEALFRGKCAYCESLLSASGPGDID